MVGLRTTTWSQRNKVRLAEAMEYATSMSMENPDIIDYGPGAMVSLFQRALPSGIRGDWTTSQKLMRSVAKPIESVLRKTGIFSLSSPELTEVIDTFKGLFPKTVYFVDVEPGVLRLVDKMKTDYNRVRGYEHDVSSSKFRFNGDIVLAYNIVQRTDDPSRALRHIEASVKPRGLLSTTSGEVDLEAFVKRGNSLYQKRY